MNPIPLLEVRIDPEFQALIPPLSAEEQALLEQSLLAEGCRDALVIWGDNQILIDGHHRYTICQEHNLPYQVFEKAFASREDIVVWIVQNQLARRNISDFVRAELALKMKRAMAAKGRANQSHGQTAPGKTLSQNLAEAIDTRSELAKLADVSHETLRKVETVLTAAPEPIKAAARRGALSTDRAFKVTRALEDAPEAVTAVALRVAPDEPEKIHILRRLHQSGASPDSNGTFAEIAATGGFHYGEEMGNWCAFDEASVSDINRALKAIADDHTRIGAASREALLEATLENIQAGYTLIFRPLTETDRENLFQALHTLQLCLTQLTPGDSPSEQLAADHRSQLSKDLALISRGLSRATAA